MGSLSASVAEPVSTKGVDMGIETLEPILFTSGGVFPVELVDAQVLPLPDCVNMVISSKLFEWK